MADNRPKCPVHDVTMRVCRKPDGEIRTTGNWQGPVARVLYTVDLCCPVDKCDKERPGYGPFQGEVIQRWIDSDAEADAD